MSFDFSNDLILENDRAVLRPLSQNDFSQLLPYALHEPDLWTYSLTSAAGEDNLKQYLSAALSLRENKTGYPFLVVDKQSNQVAGSTRFYSMDFYHKTLSIGYTWYGKDHQRTGLNRHCKFLLLSYVFDQLEMERVEFRADAKNTKSIDAMKAIGCTFEGTLRNNCAMDYGRRDSVVLSILKSEWDGGGKIGLQQLIF